MCFTQAAKIRGVFSEESQPILHVFLSIIYDSSLNYKITPVLNYNIIHLETLYLIHRHRITWFFLI